MTVEIPEVVIVIPPPVPLPILEVSKSNSSLFVYPEPPEVMSTLDTAPLATTTLAVAPSHVNVPLFNSLTL